MKNILLVLLATISSFTCFSQVSGKIFGDAGALFGLNGRANTDAFMAQYMTNANKNTKGNLANEILGSPYLTENFIKSKVYFAHEFVGEYYIRYNALNSEIEIKKTDLPDEDIKRLLANQEVQIKYGNRELLFTTYITKKDETKNGYLSIISKGDNFTLYHRLAVKFSEGKVAANSMMNDIPSRYAHFVEYYYLKNGVDRIDQLVQKRGALLKILDKELKEEVNKFLKEEKKDLDKEEDLISVFNYINTL